MKVVYVIQLLGRRKRPYYVCLNDDNIVSTKHISEACEFDSRSEAEMIISGWLSYATIVKVYR